MMPDNTLAMITAMVIILLVLIVLLITFLTKSRGKKDVSGTNFTQTPSRGAARAATEKETPMFDYILPGRFYGKSNTFTLFTSQDLSDVLLPGTPFVVGRQLFVVSSNHTPTPTTVSISRDGSPLQHDITNKSGRVPSKNTTTPFVAYRSGDVGMLDAVTSKWISYDAVAHESGHAFHDNRPSHVNPHAKHPPQPQPHPHHNHNHNHQQPHPHHNHNHSHLQHNHNHNHQQPQPQPHHNHNHQQPQPQHNHNHQQPQQRQQQQPALMPLPTVGGNKNAATPQPREQNDPSFASTPLNGTHHKTLQKQQ